MKTVAALFGAATVVPAIAGVEAVQKSAEAASLAGFARQRSALDFKRPGPRLQAQLQAEVEQLVEDYGSLAKLDRYKFNHGIHDVVTVGRFDTPEMMREKLPVVGRPWNE